MQLPVFDSEAPALRDLARRGYRHNYNLSGNQQSDPSLDLSLDPTRFRVQEVHRFEGASDPEDMCVIYAIESDTGVRGVFLDAYGSYADSRATELMRALAMPSQHAA